MGDYIKGSGSSQAAAVVSGIAALVLEAHPNYTPDQVKEAITSTARPINNTSTLCQGDGHVDALAAVEATVKSHESRQSHQAATGLGSLEAARGDSHLVMNNTRLEGEQDIFGVAFDSSTWTTQALAGSTWTNGDWNGSTWTGSTWGGSTWGSDSWAGSTWTGSTWTGSTWTGSTWGGSTWTGSTWTGSTWTGSTWGGSTWGGSTWAGLTWDHGKRIR